MDAVQGGCQPAEKFIRRGVNDGQLCRAQVASAGPGPARAGQPASVRGQIAAIAFVFVDQLVRRDGLPGQVKKQQIAKIEPHSGGVAAALPAIRAGFGTKSIHARKYRRQLRLNSAGNPDASIQAAVMERNQSPQCLIRLQPGTARPASAGD